MTDERWGSAPKSTLSAYFKALAAHDTSSLRLATSLKFTENGLTLKPGEGLWKTAGASKLQRSAFDTESCSSVTEAVIDEGGKDIVLGLRLKLSDQKLNEIESTVVRQGDYVSNPMALLGTASDDWEAVLPPEQRASRETISTIADRYFKDFPAGGCMFASDCVRYENGFSPGKCSLGLSCTATGGMVRGSMMTRLILSFWGSGPSFCPRDRRKNCCAIVTPAIACVSPKASRATACSWSNNGTRCGSRAKSRPGTATSSITRSPSLTSIRP